MKNPEKRPPTIKDQISQAVFLTTFMLGVGGMMPRLWWQMAPEIQNRYVQELLRHNTDKDDSALGFYNPYRHVSPIPAWGAPQVPDAYSQTELAQLQITIYPTEQVDLAIRQPLPSQDFQLFQALQEQQISQVVVSLVDADYLSWSAIDQLPNDARGAWYNNTRHPRRYADFEWQARQQYYDQLVVGSHLRINDAKNLSTTIDKRLVRSGQKVLQTKANGLSKTLIGGYWQAEVEDLSKDKVDLDQLLNLQQQLVSHYQYLADVYKDKESAINYELEEAQKSVAGRFIRNKTIVDGLPQTSVYIYLAVGEGSKLSPEGSFPGPDNFQLRSPSAKGYIVEVPHANHYLGYALRHEFSHWNNPDKSNSETVTDQLAYDSIVKAWDRYQQTGDDSGYPFVFVTKNGLTYTKDLGSANNLKIEANG